MECNHEWSEPTFYYPDGRVEYKCIKCKLIKIIKEDYIGND